MNQLFKVTTCWTLMNTCLVVCNNYYHKANHTCVFLKVFKYSCDWLNLDFALNACVSVLLSMSNAPILSGFQPRLWCIKCNELTLIGTHMLIWNWSSLFARNLINVIMNS